MDNNQQKRYSVRSLVYDKQNKLYEERINIVHSSDETDTLNKAEKLTEEYCNNIGLVNTGYSESFELTDNPAKDGAEVYSIMRESLLDPKEYVSKYIRTGKEVGFGNSIK